jgi:hypothetical protein
MDLTEPLGGNPTNAVRKNVVFIAAHHAFSRFLETLAVNKILKIFKFWGIAVCAIWTEVVLC